MPVATLNGGERPDNVLEGQPLLHMRILGDIEIVVIIDEVVAEGLQVGKYRERNYYHDRPTGPLSWLSLRDRAH